MSAAQYIQLPAAIDIYYKGMLLGRIFLMVFIFYFSVYTFSSRMLAPKMSSTVLRYSYMPTIL